ncbi:MAG: tyrosine-protein phosphatase [Clostridia bacterium]|nr:tyrosine-protein phosphatase [Clostridia bacterium]
MKRTVSVLLTVLLLAGMLLGCSCKKNITTGEIGVVKDEEFGNVYLALSIEDFNALGFAFGDSVDITFDNGTKLEDVPYYSGYYVPVGELLLCGYPGYPHPVIAKNYGESTWEGYGMTESSRVTVTLREKGKYIDVQELFALEYSDERTGFESDTMFANFRVVNGGNLKEDLLYRSASPCDNQHCRAPYANRLAEEHGIRFALNLSDNETKYSGYVADPAFDSAYYDSLYREGNVLLLAMNANYRSDKFAETIANALFEMTKHEGPVLVHCVEGKDRTGFVCALMFALADGSAQEIIDDYMITYANYYGVTEEGQPAKYEAILGNVYDFFYCMCAAEKGTPVETLDLKAGAENYLRRGGLTDEQISAIESFLKK